MSGSRGLGLRWALLAAGLGVLMVMSAACTREVVREVPVDRVVTQEVVKEVPVETVVEVEKEVVRTVEVEKPVEVVKEVVREVEVPGETVVVTKEVPVDVVREVTVERASLPPLIIGHLNSFTGSLSYFGATHRRAADLAAEHVNRAGGVDGGSVVILSRDTGVNPVQGVDAARALVNVENAAVIVGALASGVTIPISTTVTTPNKILQISGASTAPGITVLEDDDFLFRTAPSDAAQGVVLANLAWDEGHRNVGVMYINNAYGSGLADQFEKTFTELGGSVSASVAHEDSQATFVSELEKATDGDPDVLITMSYPGQAEVYIRESLEGGYADKFLFVDAVKSADMIEVIGWDALEGTLGTAPGSPTTPALKEFLASYQSTFAQEIPDEPFTAETYDAVVLAALAAAKAGTTTNSEAIRDALRDVANAPGQAVGPGTVGIQEALRLIAAGKDINYEGASGQVDFDENGDVFGPIEIWKIESGAIKSVGFETP